MSGVPQNTILTGDAATRLRELPDESIDCVVTSPPFYNLRSYGVDGQLGLEETVEQWVENTMAVMTEIQRVLTPTGSVWIDLADSYARTPRTGVPAKSLHLAPERLAIALVAAGFTIRNSLVWAKSNPMPDSVADRLTNTHDRILHLVKQPRYTYDLDAIRIPEPGGSLVGRNPGDVWTLPIAHYRGSHYATFPERVVQPLIEATCPLRVCTACGTPYRRGAGQTFTIGQRKPAVATDRHVRRYASSWRTLRQPGPIIAGCNCTAPARRSLVLDPFFGTGTVGAVAERLGRNWLGIELNPDYVELAWQRLGQEGPPMAQAA
jgi:DNA modification methylase